MDKSNITEQSQAIVVPECGSNEQADNDMHLSRKETREIVTPYAFFVSDDLLGTPLAKPFRRGFGLLIDLIFVSLLTQVSSLILATVAAWTFFRAGNRLQTKKRFNGGRLFLRLVVALLLFFVANGIVDEINSGALLSNEPVGNSTKSEQTQAGIEIIALTAKYLIETKSTKQNIADGDCAPAYDCFQTLGEELVTDLVAVGLTTEAIAEVREGYLDAAFDNLDTKQRTRLNHHLQQYTATLQSKNISEKESTLELPSNQDDNDNKESAKQQAEPKGIVDWLYTLIEQLGLGVSWAAIYFSVFTAWWKGQTPGKKLMGVKVVKLDNTPLNLWESFGRYGGYAAGLATGLLGFLQVFWDPNRQAIQDKISETLVIDIRKAKVPFSKDVNSLHGQ